MEQIVIQRYQLYNNIILNWLEVKMFIKFKWFPESMFYYILKYIDKKLILLTSANQHCKYAYKFYLRDLIHNNIKRKQKSHTLIQ